MRVTLNGIGQGYITDRVVDLLRANGVAQAMVDMGEIFAIGEQSAGLQDPRTLKSYDTIALKNRAVATSAGAGTIFDPAGRFNHLFEPRTGHTAWRWLSVSVEADNATAADALSTAFSLMPEQATAPIVQKLGLTAHFLRADGARLIQRG